MSQQHDSWTVDEKRIEKECRSKLDQIVQEGARRLLMEALQNEVQEYIERHKEVVDEEGHRKVVRNGSMKERDILTGAGSLPIKQPRVNDKREGKKFSSKILPRYLRRAPSIDGAVPFLYLKGISTGDMEESLEAILGPGASGLSAANVTRLKESWKEDYQEWSQRDLSKKQYVYFWADGIYFNVRLEDDRPCMLVIMGTLADGTKELVGIVDGFRESKLAWKELLLDLKKRGLEIGPQLAVGDGALGFWAALREVYPKTREQRCWRHKKCNLLNKLPKSVHGLAKKKINEMQAAPSKEEALEGFDQFIDLFGDKYPKATECLMKDKDVLFTFYDFPAAHWIHLRTTNPIESTFATVRHRTRQTKGCGSRTATLTMVFKLAVEAEKSWRRINGYELVDKVIRGVKFSDGQEVTDEEEDEKVA